MASLQVYTLDMLHIKMTLSLFGQTFVVHKWKDNAKKINQVLSHMNDEVFFTYIL